MSDAAARLRALASEAEGQTETVSYEPVYPDVSAASQNVTDSGESVYYGESEEPDGDEIIAEDLPSDGGDAVSEGSDLPSWDMEEEGTDGWNEDELIESDSGSCSETAEEEYSESDSDTYSEDYFEEYTAGSFEDFIDDDSEENTTDGSEEEDTTDDDIAEVEDADDNDYTEDKPEDDETDSDDSDETGSDEDDTEATDYTEESPDDSGDAGGGSSGGGDADVDGTDYTEESPDGDEGEDEDSSSNDESEDASGDDGSQDDQEDAEQSLSDMEKNLFSNLTAPQMAIKNTELLQNYINLNKTLEDIFININNIPRTYDNARVIEFIANRTAELRDMTSYIITDTYITRTYVENLVEYKKSLLILSQINAILKGLIKSSPSNKDS